MDDNDSVSVSEARIDASLGGAKTTNDQNNVPKHEIAIDTSAPAAQAASSSSQQQVMNNDHTPQQETPIDPQHNGISTDDELPQGHPNNGSGNSRGSTPPLASHTLEQIPLDSNQGPTSKSAEGTSLSPIILDVFPFSLHLACYQC
jgi:hypothetical protein